MYQDKDNTKSCDLDVLEALCMGQLELMLDYSNDSDPDCNNAWTPSFICLALCGGRDASRKGSAMD